MTQRNMTIALVGMLVISLLVVSQVQSYFRLSESSETLPRERMKPIEQQGENEVINSLRLLQKSIDDLQQRQNHLIASNESLQSRIAQLDDQTMVQPEPYHQADDVQADLERNFEQDLVYRNEESERKFTQKFDEMWNNNGYEEQDEAWAGEMEASFSDFQQQIEDADSSSITITSHSCGSSSCAVEFTHHGDSDMEQAQFMDDMMPEAASQVMFKEINEGGENKTLAIFMR
jgi:hypothetical protein